MNGSDRKGPSKITIQICVFVFLCVWVSVCVCLGDGGIIPVGFRIHDTTS